MDYLNEEDMLLYLIGMLIILAFIALYKWFRDWSADRNTFHVRNRLHIPYNDPPPTKAQRRAMQKKPRLR